MTAVKRQNDMKKLRHAMKMLRYAFLPAAISFGPLLLGWSWIFMPEYFLAIGMLLAGAFLVSMAFSHCLAEIDNLRKRLEELETGRGKSNADAGPV